MKALILAAGYAVRLYPLTKKYPKPLLPVAGRPIIDYVIDKLDAIADLDEIIVVTNSKFISVFKKWLAAQKRKKRISLVNDLTRSPRTRRGAIGDIDFVIKRKRIKEDLLVIGGDNLFDAGLKKFIFFANSRKASPVIGLYKLKNKSQASKYGVARLDRSGRVIDFSEKPKKPNSALVAMCLYYFPKKKLGRIKDYIDDYTHQRDATGFYIDWLRKKDPVYGFVFKGSWYDIGHHNFYEQAKRKFSQ